MCKGDRSILDDRSAHSEKRQNAGAQDEARELLAEIDASTILDFRHRALIAMMNYFPPSAYDAGSNIASPSCTPNRRRLQR